MTKKKLGYVELEWTCPSCGARNPGTRETCQTCGARMPEDVAFELPPQQELDTSDEAVARVAVGPDIICPYCGVRNPGNATVCRRCGGDLSEGARRKAGKVIGAYKTGPAPDQICPACGAKNPPTAVKCSACGAVLSRGKAKKPAITAAPAKKRSPLGVGLLLIVLLLAVFALSRFTGGGTESLASVQDVEWRYAIALEALQPVMHEGWHDELPAGAKVGACTKKVRYVLQEPVPGSTEVCGTPYVEDTGTGKGQVVQDCEYYVPDDWCRYTVNEWRPVGEKISTGHDFNPSWASIPLGADKREGDRSEEYKVIFDVGGKKFTYTASDLEEFQQFKPGSEWIIETNALGGVTSVHPKE